MAKAASNGKSAKRQGQRKIRFPRSWVCIEASTAHVRQDDMITMEMMVKCAPHIVSFAYGVIIHVFGLHKVFQLHPEQANSLFSPDLCDLIEKAAQENQRVLVLDRDAKRIKNLTAFDW